MRSDNYKNLCLEQALLSPLKYRHGCIVVKGGKVIGQGFNDYRPGYDGGTLKTGQLPTAASPRIFNGVGQSHSSNFNAFERISGMGGGQLANKPLTMHSEMMAINSALSSSSTLAASTVSYIKPCFKPSFGTKRKRFQQRDAIAAYVERICRKELEQGVQSGTAVIQGQEWRFEAFTHRCHLTAEGFKEEELLTSEQGVQSRPQPPETKSQEWSQEAAA